MSMLASVKSSSQLTPPRILVYGVHGVGKSTFAASIPGAVAIDLEDGLRNINVPSFGHLRTFAKVEQSIGELATAQHDYRAVMIDTVDSLEPLVQAETCRREGWSTFDQPYGKGPLAAVRVWQYLLDGLDVLRDRGMAVVLVEHSEVKRFDDPTSEPYDRYVLRLQARASALLCDHMDIVACARPNRAAAGGDGMNAPCGIPTIYRGRRYRSRLEARWAAFFDLLGWPYEYESFDLDGWIPDFVLIGAKQTTLVEVKPITRFDYAVANKIQRALPPGQEALLLGGTLQSLEDWWPCVGWLWQLYGHGYEFDPLTGARCPTAGWEEAALTRCELDWRKVDLCSCQHDTEEFGDAWSRVLHVGRVTGGSTSCFHGPSIQEFRAEIERAWTEAANAVQWRGRPAA